MDELIAKGCVIAEMYLGEPVFCGGSAVDQLAQIIKILGTPTQEQILQMNPNSRNVVLPNVKPTPWNKVALFFIVFEVINFFFKGSCEC